MSAWTDTLGAVGVWRGVTETDAPLAAEIERLGYGTLWLGGSPRADLVAAERLLDGTERLRVATGIVNIWMSDPGELAASYHRIEQRHPGRLFVGIGSGHREMTAQRARPLQAMAQYLDALDAGGVPVERRLVSALGPRMLELAGARSAGTHPYLTVPAQTAQARAALGPAALVAPEQTVVLEADAAVARQHARAFLGRYLRLSNYANTMRSGGLTDEDIADGGSDRLVDEIVAHGDPAAVASRVRQHLAQGADHVCVQVLPASADIRPALAALATALDL
ncbi:TIGR03620 family F420-dependent LLM class oxidoreductase [Microbacterium sp. No. 7]|uniref:TIGR03620 family F420-dependent LLM class oxidoreductase n=1 Tax=Microbacterium sp. No. 7 TaxID=1714373 RepID=UPI0006D20C44|nr:TIGR03620 family F420-dependent LLM class oxidoreductase [Microbacterium sp. No. 7]ALJ18914.1 F420-dependent oxidoreductase [Microbacterium sp. No. 7]